MMYFRLWKTVVKTVTVVKFGVNNRGSDGHVSSQTDVIKY